MTIRVVLADDHDLLRAGFRVLLDATDDLEVVGEARNGDEAVTLAITTSPDVVLMDIRMPDSDGLGATRAISADPRLAGVRVLILTTFELDDYVVEAIRAGASGFLSKSASPDELANAIRVVARGEALLSPKATTALIERFTQPTPTAPPDPIVDVLTAREREIVALVAAGHSNVELGQLLHLSPLTVKTHISRAMTKLGVTNRAQLVVIAYQSGLAAPTGRA